jgi:gas vesicle protein
MLGRMRTALKFLTCGVIIGILFAPRSGAETRRRVSQWLSSSVRETVGGFTGGQ